MRKLVVALCWLALLSMAGCKARNGTGKFESTVAKEVKQRITVGGRDWQNPVPKTEENAKIGGEHFQHHCMICHGLDGHNTGVPFAAKMDPRVPDLASKDVQDYTDGQLKWIIQNGISPSGMPGWQGILEDDEMWHIVAYLRNLPPPGSLGVPEIYKETEEEHAEAKGKGKPRSKSAARRHKHTHTHTHKPQP